MSEQYQSGLSAFEVETKVEQLEHIRQRVILVGSAAIQATFNEARRPQNIDLSVHATDYSRLRSTGRSSGWQEVRVPRGQQYLANGLYVVSAGWGDQTHEALKERAWQSSNGLTIAGTPDIYARTQADSDVEDSDFIRRRLLDPTQAPLPAGILERQVEMVRSCLPERLRHDSDAQPVIRLAANGMFIVQTLYGDPGIGRANQIIGQLEQPEFGVAATYHNGFSLDKDLQLLVNHLQRIGASDHDILLTVAAEAYSDAIYGNGRFSDNPTAHDELLSAQLVYSHALQSGLEPRDAQRLYDMILGTTFDEKTLSQRGKASPDPLVRAVVGADLQVLSEPEAVVAAIDVGIENLLSARFNRERPLGKVALARLGVGSHFTNTVQALQFIDHYPRDVPEGFSKGIKQILAEFIITNGDFHRNHQPPHDWQLDIPQLREQNAVALERIGGLMARGRMTSDQAYKAAHTHAKAMRRTFKRQLK